MSEWEEITTKVLKVVNEIETHSQREEVIKYAILMYLYKSLESEETFNNNCEILNNANYEEMRLKRFGK